MSIISQKTLDELNEMDRNKSKLSPSELQKFNEEYDSILKKMKKKKKDDEFNDDGNADFIPGPGPDDDDGGDEDEASHIPD